MPQPNINKMLKQVQQMQADMMKAQEQLKDEVVEASAGGGMVTVKMSGDREVKEIRIDPGALGDDVARGGPRDAPGHGARGRQRGEPLGAGARVAQARRPHGRPRRPRPARARRSCPAASSTCSLRRSTG